MGRTENKNLDYFGNPRVQSGPYGESLTVQSDAEYTSIREMVNRLGGIVDEMAGVDARYLDVSEFTDLADAYRQTQIAEEEFMKLSPQLRAVFKNDVTRWLDAAHDPEKIDTVYRPQLEELGLLEPKASSVVSEPPPPPPDS